MKFLKFPFHHSYFYLGFTLWNLVSGQKIKSLLVENIFFAVRLKGNHLLLNGNSQLRYVINFENLSLDQCGSSFVDGDSECEEICDVSQTKFFMVKVEMETGSKMGKPCFIQMTDTD